MQVDYQKPLPIENLVFSSGSAKGVSYVGAYEALLESGVIEKVKRISASSVGSIIATLIAVRTPLRYLREETLSTNFLELLGEKVGSFFETNPKGFSPLSRDGLPLEEKLEKIIRKSVRAFFERKYGNNQLPNNPKITLIYNRFQDNPLALLTFKDLADLHEAYPKKFKELTLVGVEFPDGEPIVFDKDSTPNCLISAACRASCAIAGLIIPKTIKIDDELKMVMDGGLYESSPTEYLDKDENNCFIGTQKTEQTLLFAFSDSPDYEKSSIYKAIYTKDQNPLYQPFLIEQWIRDYIPKIFGFQGSYTNSERLNLTYERIRAHYSSNTVILGVGEISPHHFEKATTLVRETIAIAYLDTFFSLTEKELHQNQRISINYFSRLKRNFEIIYRALLRISQNSFNDDPFVKLFTEYEQKNKKLNKLNELSSLFSKEKDLREEPDTPLSFCQKLRDLVRNRLDAFEGFGLSRAYEYANGHLSFEKLVEETYHRGQKTKEPLTSTMDLSILFGITNKSQDEPKIGYYTLKRQSLQEASNSQLNRMFYYLNQLEIKK